MTDPTRDRRLFAAIRDLLGRGLTQAEVDRLNRALYADVVGAQERHISDIGLKHIQDFEGYRPTTYPDPAPGNKGLPVTGGWGTTRDEAGRPLQLGITWPRERWEALLRADITKYE